MKNKIYLKHWLELKPKNYSSNTDLYYLKIANEIYSNLDNNTLTALSQLMNKEDIYILCCFITCYFEDIISQTNIWQAFKEQYAQQHHKKLPFYNIDDNYIDEEINVQDIAFLIWYFTNSLEDEWFVTPYSDTFLILAEQAISVLDEAFEYAPENEQLKKLFDFKPHTDEFYETRAFLQMLFFDSYLFYPDVKRRFDFSIFEIIEESKDEDSNSIMGYIREVTDEFTFNKVSSLLSLRSKDWAKQVLGPTHKSYNDISSISEKITGLFLYKKQNNESVTLEHIASGIVFEMTKKSFDNSHNLNEDAIIYIGLVKYKNEWWFSGNFFMQEFNADTILDQKNSAQTRAEVNFLRDENEIGKIMQKQKKAFLDFNDNSLIAFVKSNTLNAFVNDYFAFFNNSLNLTKEESENVQKRTKADGYFGNEANFEGFDNDTDEIVVFFNSVSGLEMYPNILNAFPDKKNPFFKEEDREDALYILMAPDYSTEFTNYFIENYKDKLSIFEKEPYRSYFDDLDFLLKFWKKDKYKSKNTIALTGREI
ncbi:DUF3843 family protein [Winogradskyella forsetii]|uniref:DUF3843 family protein n=1 Tax=Winogradskyella forsetii TaxID=2686077 RepID=UPI0015B877F6|nr:DUF3843 family protein [Winogradskyella forsetii]